MDLYVRPLLDGTGSCAVIGRLCQAPSVAFVTRLLAHFIFQFMTLVYLLFRACGRTCRHTCDPWGTYGSQLSLFVMLGLAASTFTC